MHDVLEEAGRKLVRLGGDAGGGALQETDAAYADVHIVQGSGSQGRADGRTLSLHAWDSGEYCEAYPG